MREHKVTIIGMGYIGLPLAVETSKKYNVIGFDISTTRIDDLKKGLDSTLEIEEAALKKANNLTFSNDAETVKECNFYIVTVPTPIDKNNRPNLGPLQIASSTIGKNNLKSGDVIVFGSMVSHTDFNNLNCVELKRKNCVLYDVKGILPAGIADKVL